MVAGRVGYSSALFPFLPPPFDLTQMATISRQRLDDAIPSWAPLTQLDRPEENLSPRFGSRSSIQVGEWLGSGSLLIKP